jgi:deoxycytidylate deaminase
MNKPIKKNILVQKSTEQKGKTTIEKVEKTFTEELIIGICSPIGSLYLEVIDVLEEKLKKDYHYKVNRIKISEFIKKYYDKKPNYKIGETHKFSDLMFKIEGGDYLRKFYHNNSILVELAIKQIREGRQVANTPDIKGERICYIIDSLKNIEELNLLRTVYGDIFYLFSIFSPEDERKDNLIQKKGLSSEESNRIINTDEFEDLTHGQNVRDTFVDADFFLRVSKKNIKDINNKVKRFLHLIFNSEIITPNYDETAMYYAKSSAGNSACLSRQVGAAITDKSGTTIATGWNDVPKFGGNLYRETDINVHRCKELKYCSNVEHINEIIEDITNDLETIYKQTYIDKTGEQMTLGPSLSKEDSEVKLKIKKILKKSKIKNILEYSRSVHAEMHAIIIGSQLTNNKMVGGNLYVTTYPCHNCARHIILAGISNIYYIEPYKKSLGIILYEDSFTEDEKDDKKVRILLYEGVAPRRYLDFYSMKGDERKDKEGKINKIDLKVVVPKIRLSLQAIPELENQAIHSLVECGLIKEELL